LIDEHGLSVLPISSLGLNYPVSEERISSGIDRLDAMMGGKGYYRGSSILISGTAARARQPFRGVRRQDLPDWRALPLFLV